MKDEIEELPDFSPDDPLDGREIGSWQTRYSDPLAKRCINQECIYLFFLLFSVPFLMFIIWIKLPNSWLHLSDEQYSILVRYSLAWLGGTLGGVAFNVKWFYHSVAKQLWNIDRRFWRIFTPHLSGSLAFIFVALISSGLLRIFDSSATASSSMIVSVSFLVGYFSDSAIAKLSEVAQTLFGAARNSGDEKK